MKFKNLPPFRNALKFSGCRYGFDRDGNVYRFESLNPDNAVARLSDIIRRDAGRFSGIALSPSGMDDDNSVKAFASSFSLLCSFSHRILLDFSAAEPDAIQIRDFISEAAAEMIGTDDNRIVFAALPEFHNEEEIDLLTDCIRMNGIEAVVTSNPENLRRILSISSGRMPVYASLESYSPEKALKMLNEGAIGLIFKETLAGNIKIKSICKKCLKELKSV